jgi:phage-related minor tail protein
MEDYGQIVDRIMGGASSLVMGGAGNELVEQISAYAELCKLVGYKCAQVQENPELFTTTVAFLADATEMLDKMMVDLGTEDEKSVKDLLNQTFLDRLRWINERFSEDLRGSVAIEQEDKPVGLDQSEIDNLLKKMGLA